MRAGLLALLALAAGPAASDPVLEFPVDCDPGNTCFIQNFVDHDPGQGVRDFRCGGLSYDGHKGTDFALPTLQDMQDGVAVLAAAPGIVKGRRDGMEDRAYDPMNAAAVADRECGNGVVIAHDDGWETQYCHMRRGSVRVRSGDVVKAGTVLGQIGLSGKTEFPHLHLSVRQKGQVVDPFDPARASDCGSPAADLWQETPDYVPGALLTAGFSDHVPDFADIRAGRVARTNLPSDAPGLVLFGYAFGGQAGDVLRLRIDGPEGEVATHEAALDRAQAQYFRAAGRRLRGERWPSGTYRGEVTILRNGQQIDHLTVDMVIK